MVEKLKLTVFTVDQEGFRYLEILLKRFVGEAYFHSDRNSATGECGYENEYAYTAWLTEREKAIIFSALKSENVDFTVM